jgi:hypothetical protein
MERAGFKEWLSVCQAIADGRQTTIIRKGGIAEGREGFSFKHRRFYLFPTGFHEEAKKITEPQFSSPTNASTDVTIRCAVTVEWSGAITDWSIAEALAPFHILREEVVRERFEYKDAPGVHVAFVRAFRLSKPWTFPNEKRFGGCRSWVELPERVSDFELVPVLGESESDEQLAKLKQIVNGVCELRNGAGPTPGRST